jgi:hypothetical protein
MLEEDEHSEFKSREYEYGENCLRTGIQGHTQSLHGHARAEFELAAICTLMLTEASSLTM